MVIVDALDGEIGMDRLEKIGDVGVTFGGASVKRYETMEMSKGFELFGLLLGHRGARTLRGCSWCGCGEWSAV